ATGDGHHENTDVLAAWFSEAAGRLQAVTQVSVADWQPMHVNSDAAGWAVLFEAGAQRRFVRVEALKTTGQKVYDHGTWTPDGGFASAGATTGEVVPGPGGTATIDVPAATGALPGAVLARPFALTYERTGSAVHWVDRAPGGVTPGEAAFGADYVVGSCAPGAEPPPPGGGTAGAGDGAATTTAVVLDAPARRVGAGRVRASGRVTPPRGGVPVRVTATAARSPKAWVRSVTTRPDGTFAVWIPLSESSMVTARAEGINAQTRTITVRSTVRMRLRRLAGGRTVVSGRLRPRLPGRVLLLRVDAAVPSATTMARRGRFRFPARRLARGRYQAVYIPARNRAERSTSASGVIR
ncbi:MAG: hypothetical protein QOE13_3485, partial [Gaiellaceae bacterium]|nr:hypothetical protein [Gaiellaceae bacterium]